MIHLDKEKREVFKCANCFKQFYYKSNLWVHQKWEICQRNQFWEENEFKNEIKISPPHSQVESWSIGGNEVERIILPGDLWPNDDMRLVVNGCTDFEILRDNLNLEDLFSGVI